MDRLFLSILPNFSIVLHFWMKWALESISLENEKFLSVVSASAFIPSIHIYERDQHLYASASRCFNLIVSLQQHTEREINIWIWNWITWSITSMRCNKIYADAASSCRWMCVSAFFSRLNLKELRELFYWELIMFDVKNESDIIFASFDRTILKAWRKNGQNGPWCMNHRKKFSESNSAVKPILKQLDLYKASI